MKCIYCGSDTKYRDRRTNGGHCAACKHAFAFEPMTDTRKVTDGLFKKMVEKVSGGGKLSFTERQLWYEFNRRYSRARFWWGPWGRIAAVSGLGGGAAAVGLTILFPLTAPLTFAMPAALGACGVGFAAAQSRRIRRTAPVYTQVPFGAFTNYLHKWVHAHGPIERLLPLPAAQPLPARQVEPDLTAYSFDRALVTDHAETAAMLVANNFHFENNCAILSADGYPPGRTETIMEMLRRNPQLQVYALHDATAPGCLLIPTLREEKWFPDRSIRIVDLGLRPQHVPILRPLIEKDRPHAVPGTLRAILTPEEVAWLEQGNRAELAALRPAKLMRAVYQGFARTRQALQTDTGSSSFDSGPSGGVIWINDSGADVYAADSFG